MAEGIINNEERRYSPLLRYSSGGNEEDAGAQGHDVPDLGRTKVTVHQRYFLQILSVVTACLCVIAAGMSLAYSSPVVPELLKLGILNDDQASWFGSVVTIGAISGGPLAGLMVNRYGRKLTIMTTALPFTAGSLIIVATKLFPVLIVGRVLTGVGLGMASMCVPIYIAEVTSKNIRGILGAGFQLTCTLGVVLMYTLDIPLSWRWLTIAISLPCALMTVILQFMPESPRWLLSKGLYSSAARSLITLRGPDYDVDAELNEINRTLTTNEYFPLRDILSPQIRKPLLICMALMFFQQFSGIGAVLFNTNAIFENAGFPGNSSLPTVIVGIVQLVSGVIACVLVDYAGRRFLLVLSGACLTLSSTTFGLYYYLDQVKDMQHLQWLSLGSIVIYMIGFFLGWGPVPWLMNGELFPVKAQGIACTICTMFNWTCCFLVTKEYIDLRHSLEDYGTFWLFASLNLIGVIFVIFFVPETKGKTLEEIEEYFNNRSAESINNYSVTNYGSIEN